MKVVALMLCCVLVAQANVLSQYEYREAFEKFIANHQKTYNDEVEREFRFKIFVENLIKIIKHNREYDEGKQTHTLRVNKMADMLESEVFNGLNVPTTQKKNLAARRQGVAVPDSFDWRDKGAVTPVKDQGSCGSCWAFSATGSMEGALFMKTGKLVSLSEKNLMDCSRSYGNYGCNGGWMDSAFDYVIANGGIDTEESYPYRPVDGSCQYDASNSALTLKSYVDLPVGDEDALKEAVATVGPISVAINANFDFQLYDGGVMTSDNCSPSGLNHGVMVVGYGNEDGKDYWLVKNSWGTSFGESGYIKMRRNYNNMCGITEAASYPTL